MMCVLLGKDARTDTGLPPITNDSIAIQKSGNLRFAPASAKADAYKLLTERRRRL